jgi:hypothetical protein
MMGAPAPITAEQLAELSLRVLDEGD